MNNNEVAEVKKYTNTDILKAVSKMSESERDFLLESLNIQAIRKLLNGEEDFRKYCNNLTIIANSYKMLVNVLQTFKENIDVLLSDDIDTMRKPEKKDTTEIIDDMIGEYEKFSREEKLEFNKKLMDATNLASSIDTFSYTWGKLMKTLSGMKA